MPATEDRRRRGAGDRRARPRRPRRKDQQKTGAPALEKVRDLVRDAWPALRDALDNGGSVTKLLVVLVPLALLALGVNSRLNGQDARLDRQGARITANEEALDATDDRLDDLREDVIVLDEGIGSANRRLVKVVKLIEDLEDIRDELLDQLDPNGPRG